MKKYYGYIRVSTIRQGEKGTSLVEQKAAIESYCRRENITISRWFEEQQTAAKMGRIVFVRMLKEIKKGGAAGLVLHKIDRGARNLKDWAELSQLVDSDIDVRIAGDAVDLRSRGGRLSGDILAVVAADYIRNLREEVKKGQVGRLKQGQYPWAAPVGYLNTGRGGIKAIDPVQAPLVREAFMLYASGKYSVKALCKHMTTRGLTTARGSPITLSTFHSLLHRPFYYGRIVVNGASYVGAHEPLISKQLFDQVQEILRGRHKRLTYRQVPYRFQRKIRCFRCDRILYAETQKGHVYYRCHTGSECRGICLRETAITEAILHEVAHLPVGPELVVALSEMFEAANEDQQKVCEETRSRLVMQLGQVKARHDRLMDGYLERMIERDEYEVRQASLTDEKITLQSQLDALAVPAAITKVRSKHFLELLRSLGNLASVSEFSDFQQAVMPAISNLVATKKGVEIQWKNSIQVLLDCSIDPIGVDEREAYRTSDASVRKNSIQENMKKIVDSVLSCDAYDHETAMLSFDVASSHASLTTEAA